MLTAIVSPSGKFYGSEQTLHSFLTYTDKSYHVYISRNDGSLLAELGKLGKHTIRSFRKPSLLYLRLLAYFIAGRYTCLYVNEGAHIKYVKILAMLFPHRKLLVHVRINEDTTRKRLKGLPPNIELISVSNYIRNQIKHSIKLETDILSSPFRIHQSDKAWRSSFLTTGKINVGIIGRVTDSKGMDNVRAFYQYMTTNRINFVSLHFFGHIENDKPKVKEFIQYVHRIEDSTIKFHGFAKNKNEMFDTIDVVVHFNENEPHGVIFFESLKNGIPFIGFNSGGIGDIADQLNITELMLTSSDKWCEDLTVKIQSIHQNLPLYTQARYLMNEKFSLKNYCARLEDKFK